MKKFLPLLLYIPLAVFYFLAFTAGSPPSAPKLTLEQERLIPKPASFLDLWYIGRPEEYALKMADFLEQNGHAQSALEWRHFDAEHKRALDMRGAITGSAVIGMGLIAFAQILKACFRRKATAAPQSRPTPDHAELATELAVPVTLFLLCLYLVTRPVYYSEFASIIDSITVLYALGYAGTAVRQRQLGWQSRRKNPAVETYAEAAPLFEICSGLIVVAVWGAWYFHWYTAMGPAAGAIGFILRLFGIFFPWVMLFAFRRYTHLREEAIQSFKLALAPIMIAVCMIVFG